MGANPGRSVQRMSHYESKFLGIVTQHIIIIIFYNTGSERRGGIDE